jgi:UDP-N-acetylglucosamine--N-acetylmuramyl-(pentapeptide) pyrophosphoryl-undecaprenol N-acetylglucosamine transferase
VSGCVVLAAGGTGGHVFPAEAVADELLGRGRKVHLMSEGRADAIAARIPGIEVHRVRAGRFDGGPGRAVRGLADLVLGTVRARQLLRRLAPTVVIGFGGYASVPTMLAAVGLRLPTIIHEQNAVLGRANRRLAPHARRIATGFPTSAGVRPTDRAKCVHTGNPVRRAVLAIGDREYRAPEPGRPIELLILGGSQGARVLSEVVPPALAALPSRLREPLRVSQQVRSEDFAAVAEVYRRHRIAAELSSFFEDVPARLARANLAICRAGASTVSELAAAGRPAVLIPYPHAADDHQTANARSFVEVGGGWVIPQSDLSPDILAVRLGTLLSESAALIAAAERARSFSRRDATQRLARLVLDLEPHTDCGAGPPGRAA